MKNTRSQLAIFDLDGTITRKDTLLEFIRFTHGTVKLWSGLFLISPFAFFSLLNVISRQTLKEKLLTIFFKGRDEAELKKVGDDFGQKILPGLCKTKALEKISWHKQQQHEIVILSASCDVWLSKWCGQMDVRLIGSQMEFKNHIATGKLQGKNCKGPEKAERLRQEYNLADFSYIYAYGNSESDRHYYKLANEFHHNAF